MLIIETAVVVTLTGDAKAQALAKHVEEKNGDFKESIVKKVLALKAIDMEELTSRVLYK